MGSRHRIEIGDAGQTRVGLAQAGQRGVPREIAGADHADDRPGRRRTVALVFRQGDGRLARHLVLRIRQHDAQRITLLCEHTIGLCRVGLLDALSDQRRSVQTPRGEEVKDGLEVALLGPAHEARRIVVSAILPGP